MLCVTTGRAAPASIYPAAVLSVSCQIINIWRRYSKQKEFLKYANKIIWELEKSLQIAKIASEFALISSKFVALEFANAIRNEAHKESHIRFLLLNFLFEYLMYSKAYNQLVLVRVLRFIKTQLRRHIWIFANSSNDCKVLWLESPVKCPVLCLCLCALWQFVLNLKYLNTEEIIRNLIIKS